MKTPTSWSSATKQQTDWTAARRSVTPWANNDVKVAAAWANHDTKYATAWNIPTALLQTYFYDDATRTYDDIGYDYDYLVNGNSISNRNQTIWSAA